MTGMTGDKPKVSKAQQKAVAKYMKNNYDEIKIRTDKGQKAVIKSHAEQQGESMNQFIIRAINETMTRDDSPQLETTNIPSEIGDTSSTMPENSNTLSTDPNNTDPGNEDFIPEFMQHYSTPEDVKQTPLHVPERQPGETRHFYSMENCYIPLRKEIASGHEVEIQQQKRQPSIENDDYIPPWMLGEE